MPSISERIEKIENEIRGCVSLYHVDSYDQEFLRNAKHHPSLTPKQEAHLQGIERRVFGKQTTEPE